MTDKEFEKKKEKVLSKLVPEIREEFGEWVGEDPDRLEVLKAQIVQWNIEKKLRRKREEEKEK